MTSVALSQFNLRQKSLGVVRRLAAAVPALPAWGTAAHHLRSAIPLRLLQPVRHAQLAVHRRRGD